MVRMPMPDSPKRVQEQTKEQIKEQIKETASRKTVPNDSLRDDLDSRFMRDALALGWRQQGRTSPNPAVGCIIAREIGGRPVVVGRGSTQDGGRPHGEPIALAMAGEAARGATLYVTLEPCSHHGRAGPCSDAIIAAGIGRVVSAIEDPDPRVKGQGHARMAAAGIAITLGVLAKEAARAHRGHFLRVQQGRPAVAIKLARTRDGYAAASGDERLLITGESANQRVHLLRAHSDAILVGVETVLADDPQLTVRLPGMEALSPVRVVLDSALRTPLGSVVVKTAAVTPTWIVTTEQASATAAQKLEEAGAIVLRVAADAHGRVDLHETLRLLAACGVAKLLCEGGPTLAEALVAAELADELVLLTGPSALGRAGQPALGPQLAQLAGGRADFHLLESGFHGADEFAVYERLL